MNWNCSSCGVDNAGGLFCIGCGSKKPETSESRIDGATVSAQDGQTASSSTKFVPWIVTGAALVATLAFGGWQSSLATTAGELVATTMSELSSARSNYSEALDTAASADSVAETCYYASWCWASTYSNLLDEAQTANAIAEAFGSEVTRLEGVLVEAQDEFDRYTNATNAAWGIGGIGTLGSGIWAFIAQSRRKESGEA